MIAAGKYKARALSAEIGYAKTGSEMVLVNFQIADSTTVMPWYGTITESSAKRVMESLLFTGWDGVDFENWNGLGSKEVELVIEEEPDASGKLWPRVKWVNRLGGGSLKQVMTQPQRAHFAAKMKGVVAEVLGSAGAPQRPASPPRQPAPARRGGQGAPPREYGDGSEFDDNFDDNVPF